MAPAPGSTLGPYRVVEQLGLWGFTSGRSRLPWRAARTPTARPRQAATLRVAFQGHGGDSFLHSFVSCVRQHNGS